MKCTVGVMDLEVSSLSAVSLNVDCIDRHSVSVCAEDGGLIHIVPEAVHVVAALEYVIVEKTAPELLRVLVEEVDPSRIARPAVAIEWRSSGLGTVSHKDVRVVASWLILVLTLDTLGIDEVVLGSLDMWVDDDDDSASRSLNLRVHVAYLSLCKVLRVELEVFVAFGVIILLRVLYV